MAIFMDRHDLTGFSAQDLAQAHEMDLEIQDEYSVKFMSYWFDDDSKTGFCSAVDTNRYHLKAPGHRAQKNHLRHFGDPAERVADDEPRGEQGNHDQKTDTQE